MVTKNDIDSAFFSLKSDNTFDQEEQENSEIKIEKSAEEDNIFTDEISKDNDQNINLLFNSSKRGFSNRLFGKIEPGSMRGSIFTMTILSLGSGCLSLPKAMGEMSLVMGIISILLTASATYWTLNLLCLASEEHQIFNYSKLVRKLFGNTMGLILDLSIVIYIFVFKILGEVVYNFGGFFEQEQFPSIELFLTLSFWNFTWVKLLVMYGITTGIILPISLLKDISKLRIGSLLGVITLIFLIFLIIIQSPDYIRYYWDYTYKEDDESTHLNIFSLSSSFDSNLYFFQGTATLFYSFTSHLGAFPVFGSLTNNVNRRLNKVILRTILLDSFFFLIISIFGYLTWPINTPSLIIERDNIKGGAEIVMSLGRLGLITIIILKLPVSYNAFRTSFYEMVLGDSVITNKRNWLLTVPTLFIAVIIGILYNQITGYIKLLGGFCSTFIGYVMPCMIYIRSNNYPLYHWKNIITIILIIIMATIGFTSGVITLLKIIRGEHD